MPIVCAGCNVIVPRMDVVPRRLLAGPEAAATVAGSGFDFPFLVRAPGFHTGRYFVRVENLPELAEAAASFPGDDVCLIEALDAREGLYRKCRVIDYRPQHLPDSSCDFAAMEGPLF